MNLPKFNKLRWIVLSVLVLLAVSAGVLYTIHEFKEQQEANAKLTKELKKQAETLDKLLVDNNNLTENVERLTEANEKVLQANKQVTEEKNKLDARLKVLEQQNSNLSSTIKKLEQENTNLKKQVVASKNTQKTSYTSVSRGTSTPTGKKMTVKATAYTAYCNGCSGTTATGINLRANPDVKVIAVDPRVIPLGTKVHVEGYGYAVAGDTGGAIKGNKVDLFVKSKSQATNWGVRNVTLTILN